MLKRAFNLAGDEIHPSTGVFPILKELEPNKLRIIGTGFYITRYGLFLTAKHVVEDALDEQRRLTHRLLTFHNVGDSRIHVRNVLRFSSFDHTDIALGELENFIEMFPDDPLLNVHAILTTKPPPAGSGVLTFAYPRNEIIDWADNSDPGRVSADYSEGRLLRQVEVSEHPYIHQPYYETTVRVMGGASGGPVFNERGRVFGINCRGWDFGGGEGEGEGLSYMVRVNECLELGLENLKLPANSWDLAQIPEDRRASVLHVRDLAKFGHVVFDPPLVAPGA